MLIRWIALCFVCLFLQVPLHPGRAVRHVTQTKGPVGIFRSLGQQGERGAGARGGKQDRWGKGESDLPSPKFCDPFSGLNRSISAAIKDLEVLKDEAAEKKFPDNELLRRLGAVLKDVERCQRTSAELLGRSAAR